MPSPAPIPQPPTPISQPLGFVVADVSDKGVPAAMFMTLSRSLMRAAALDGSSPSVALGRANRWISRDSESAMFVTLFYGILQPETGELRFGCAGHNPPLLFRTDGEVRELTTPGIALGVLEDAVLGEDQVTLDVGDILVCYTDGLTEAINGAEDAFGVQRLVDAVAANREQSAEALVAVINGALLRFTERPPFDDLTLVVIKRVGDENQEPRTEEPKNREPKNRRTEEPELRIPHSKLITHNFLTFNS